VSTGTDRTKRRAEAALALRIAGASYEDIAQTLGYMNARTASTQIEKALARSITSAGREEQRDLAGRRLERLLRSAWPKAVNADSPEHLAAVRTCKDIIDRHVRLYGLDAPAEIVVHTPTTSEIEAWVASVLTTATADVIEADVVEDVDQIMAVTEPETVVSPSEDLPSVSEPEITATLMPYAGPIEF